MANDRGDVLRLFEGAATDISVNAGYDRTPGYERHFVRRGIDFFNNDRYLLQDDGSLTPIDAPTDASVSTYKTWMLVRTNSPWTVGDVDYPAGALLATDFEAFPSGARQFDVLFEPDAQTSLHQYGWTENHLLLGTLSDVQTKLYTLTPTADGWQREPLGDAPAMATTFWATSSSAREA